MYDLLSTIDSPLDLKKLDVPQLAQLAREVREYILDTVSNTGGHLAPSLGVVELTLVLHYIYNSPSDKIVWDVGHQAYVHKIITGRRDVFKTIRQYKGISGFPKMSESPHDVFGVGHASTSISAAFGLACARDLLGENNHVLAVVGDGALTGGLSYEGLNNAGASGRNLVVILNDNTMSISPNVGAMSRYLTQLITNPFYNRIKSDIWDITGKYYGMGKHIRWATRRIQESLKAFLTPGILFERLGFRYFGPIDGHNIAGLLRIFNKVKTYNGPILVHVLTKKGKGFKPAEQNASKFHGLGKFDRETGFLVAKSNIPSYTKVFSETIIKIAEKNKSIVGITAAMALGTGLGEFSEKYPERFFDVGIAEAHAVTFAAGLAAKGFRPVTALYSSFLQRGYDNLIHDVALQKLPVIFALDRAGLVGDDGPTHHGVFDMAFLRTIPNLVLMVPKDEEELRCMLWTAAHYQSGPVVIRYPRGQGVGVKLLSEINELAIGKSEIVRQGIDAAIIAVGPILYNAIKAAEILQSENIDIEIINARFLKPFDFDMLKRVLSTFSLIMTIEEGTIKGGLGSEVAESAFDIGQFSVEIIRKGIPDEFVSQGPRNILLDECGLSVEGIVSAIKESNHFRKFKLSKKYVPNKVSKPELK